MENTNTQICSIQNNDVTVEFYVSEFNSFARKTAEAILRMAEVVCLAKKNLVSDAEKLNSFDDFCKQIGLKPKSSMIRKFLKIGEMASYLNGHLEKLPNSWTTIYTLACQSTNHLVNMFEKQLISPTMTAQRLAEVIAAETGKPSGSDSTEKNSDPKASKGETTKTYKLEVLFDIVPSATLARNLELAIKKYIERERMSARSIRSQSLIELLDQSEEEFA